MAVLYWKLRLSEAHYNEVELYADFHTSTTLTLLLESISVLTIQSVL